MGEHQAPRFEPIPFRLVSLSAQFDAVTWPTLAGMTFTNSTGSKILQRTVNVRTTEDGWMFRLLNRTRLTDPVDPLLEAATQVVDVLSKLRAVGRGAEAAEPADV